MMSILLRFLGILSMLIFNVGNVPHAQTRDLKQLYIDCIAKPKSEIQLGTPEEGIISELKVDRGYAVKKGQVVAILDQRIQKLTVEIARINAANDVDVRSAKARLEFRDIETDRAKKLFDKSIISEKIRDEATIERRLAKLEVETAEIKNKLAKAELKRVREQLNRRYIRSPVDGIVIEVEMAVGEYAHDQSVLMTIVEIDPLYVEAFVPVEYYNQIKVGGVADVVFKAPVSETHQAKVTVVDQIFDSASRTFGVRLEIKNTNHRLPAGLNCQLRFLNR